MSRAVASINTPTAAVLGDEIGGDAVQPRSRIARAVVVALLEGDAEDLAECGVGLVRSDPPDEIPVQHAWRSKRHPQHLGLRERRHDHGGIAPRIHHR